MSRIFIWLESSSTLNFVSERDPDEIVQTHMLSWAFAAYIRHKYQQGLYQLIWGSAQDGFMLGSELCSWKEHMHRMTEVRSVSHAAWAYCGTGKSFKILKRIAWESQISQHEDWSETGFVGNHEDSFSRDGNVPWIKKEMMTTCEFLQACR